MRTTLTAILLLGTAILAGLCFVWPVLTVLREIWGADWSLAFLSGRQLALLGRGIAVAAAAAGFAQILGAALAVGLTAGNSSFVRGIIRWGCLIVLLTPPYIYAYAWGLVLLPGGVVTGATQPASGSAWLMTTARAVWCLAAWTAPIAGGLLASQWRATGQTAYTLALLDAKPWQAFRRAALPTLLPGLALSFLFIWIIGITEYSVCHLCLVQTWNTEVLAEIQVMGTPEHPIAPGQALLLAWPLLAVAGALTAMLWLLRKPFRQFLGSLAGLREADWAAGSIRVSGQSRWWNWLPGAAIAALLVPWAILIFNLREPAAFLRAWHVYPHEWPGGLRYAAASGLISAALAVGVNFILAAPRRGFSFPARIPARAMAYGVLLAAGLGALAPPALVGDTFKAAYLNVPAIGDYWPILALTTAARFSFLALLVLHVAERLTDGEFNTLAAVDGASWPTAYFRVRLPLCWPALAWAATVAGLLSFTEVAAACLVQPPGTGNLAVTLLNAIHFGRNDDVITMSLYLMVFLGLAVGALQWLARRRKI